MEHENITQAPCKVQRKFAFNHVFLQIMQNSRPKFPYFKVRHGREFKRITLLLGFVLLPFCTAFMAGMESTSPKKNLQNKRNVSAIIEQLLVQKATAQITPSSSYSVADTNTNYTLSSSDSAFVDSLMQLSSWDY